MSIIAIITDPGKGGTFLSWSLHYLSGHTRSFHGNSNAWFPLPKNPLTNINSHNFKTNDIKVYSEFRPCIDNLISLAITSALCLIPYVITRLFIDLFRDATFLSSTLSTATPRGFRCLNIFFFALK